MLALIPQAIMQRQFTRITLQDDRKNDPIAKSPTLFSANKRSGIRSHWTEHRLSAFSGCEQRGRSLRTFHGAVSTTGSPWREFRASLARSAFLSETMQGKIQPVQMLTIPGGSGCNGYGYFFAKCPAGTAMKLYAEKLYELRVNGMLIAYGPVKSGEPLCYYDSFLLPAGKHDVDVAIKVHGKKKRIGLVAILVASDGMEWIPDWKCRIGRANDSASPYTVGEVGYSEYYDFAAGEDNWFEASFFADAQAPVVGRTLAGEFLKPRPITMLEEVERFPVKTERMDNGWRVDFGEMVFGRLVIAGCAEKSGRLRIGYIESDQAGWAHREGLLSMYEDRLENIPGVFKWKSFAKRGFRLIQIEGSPVTLDNLSVMEYRYPIRPLGHFECSDPELNRIRDIAVSSLRICLDDIYNDCPHRDQAQWMDAFLTAQVAFGYSGVRDLTRKCLQQYAGFCGDDGRMPATSSSPGGGYMPDYAMVMLFFVRWYYRVTGDRDLLVEIHGTLEKIIGHVQRYRTADHLIEHINRDGELYLDNTFELCRMGKSAAFNALYYGALASCAEIRRVLNLDDVPYLREAEWVRKSFHDVFRNEDGTLRDSDSRPEVKLENINFFCELHQARGSAARVTFTIHRPERGKKTLLSGAYAEYRVMLNGKTVFDDSRPSDWWRRNAPCYELNAQEVIFEEGENLLVFDVRNAEQNWDLFFQAEGVDFGRGLVREMDYATGVCVGTEITVSPRTWHPPKLSQSTHGYAAYCGLIDDPEVLRKTIPQHYYRNYISVRVPLFSVERSVPDWTMPCNTPYSAYYFIASLFRAGLAREGLDWIRMAWGVMLQNGATSGWEEFNVNASLCHAWGCIPMAFFLYDILGVKLDRLHENVLTVRPDLGGLKFARGRVAVSEDRYVEVSLELRDGRTRVAITPPEGVVLSTDLSRLAAPEIILNQRT